jgi:hypothetical protein
VRGKSKSPRKTRPTIAMNFSRKFDHASRDNLATVFLLSLLTSLCDP